MDDVIVKALRRFSENPLEFGRVCIPDMFKEKSPQFHKELEALYLDPSVTFANIIAPRGHAKTSITGGVFALHHAFCTPGQHFVLFVSKTGGHASRMLQTVKGVMEHSAEFQYFFGEHSKRTARVWREDIIILDNGDVFMSKGTGQHVVGLKVGNQRPTFILLDDPEDMENTKTEASMEYNLRWMLQTLVPARDAKRGRVWIIGTPQHERCMVELLKESPQWNTRQYQALSQWVEDDEELQKKIISGEVECTPNMSLWPDLWDAKKLLLEKTSMASIGRVSSWYREYQCKIVHLEDAFFKPENLQYYEGDVEREDDGTTWLVKKDGDFEIERVLVHIYMGVDLATSMSDRADYTVIMPVALDGWENIYVLPYVRRKMPPSVTLQMVEAQYKKWQPMKLRVEVSGQQEAFADHLRRLDPPIRLATSNPKDKKTKRYLEKVEPIVNRRQLFLQKSQMSDLRNEMISFRPEGGHAHDDMIDALYYATLRTSLPDKVRQIGKEKVTPKKSAHKLAGSWVGT